MRTIRPFIRKSSVTGVSKITRGTYRTSTMSWWEISAAVRKRDRNLCVQCFMDKKIVKGTEVHHIIALSKGGTTTMANLILLCEACHNQRHGHLLNRKQRK